MSTIKANQLKGGMFVLFKDAPHEVVKCEFYFPGKGSAFARTRLKNVRTGSVQDFTYKSSETVEIVEVETIELQYLYADGDLPAGKASTYYFMNPRTFDQFEVKEWVFDGKQKYLLAEMKMFFNQYEGEIIGVRFPPKVTLKVTEAQDAVAGNTVQAAKKPAMTENGFEVMVPLFVKSGETIIVDTESGEYVSRG